jgi:glycerol kinase
MAVEELNIDEVVKNWKLKKRYEPRMGKDERESRLTEWNRAVGRSKNWVIHE